MSNDTIIGHITESNKRKSDGYTPKPSERLMLSREQDEPTAIAPEREGSVYEAVLSQKVNTTGSTEVTDLSQRPLQSPENDRTLRVETTADGEVADNALAVTDANEHTRHIERVHTESGTTKEKGLPLQAAWHEYVAVRRRFLATYKRDKKEWTKQDRKIIDTGNQTVHGGSCIIDAHMCQQADAHPNDMEVYQQLYGLTPAEALTISTLHDDIKGAVAHGKTIKSMDRHATAVANKDKTATQAFRDGFARFITELRETGITNDWDARSGVGKAYKDFKNAKT